jgi:hypothetical protein
MGHAIVKKRNSRAVVVGVEQVEARLLLSAAPHYTVKEVAGQVIYPRTINDSGQYIGTEMVEISPEAPYPNAFFYDPKNNVSRDIVDFGLGVSSFAYAINNSGQVVGYSNVVNPLWTTLPDGYFDAGFVTDPNGGAFHLLGAPSANSVGWTTRANDINDSGEVVGEEMEYPSFGNNWASGEWAVLWTATGGYDLNKLIPANSGVTLTRALGINNDGQISAISSNGHYVLLTPAPPAPTAPVITWANPADIVYGTPLSATQLDATASVPGTFTYTPAEGTVLHAGAAQTLSATFTPTDTVDYTTVTATAQINVAQAPLTVMASNATKVYGAALPTLTVDYSGFVNGDTAASLATQATATTSATSASHVGSYSITAAGAADPDYAITHTDGALTVTPAPLTVTANNATKVQGQANPPLSGTTVGLVNGDTDTATYSTTATTSSPAGSYPIVPSLVDSNYAITFVNGTLTVTPSGHRPPPSPWVSLTYLAAGCRLGWIPRTMSTLDAVNLIPDRGRDHPDRRLDRAGPHQHGGSGFRS